MDMEVVDLVDVEPAVVGEAPTIVTDGEFPLAKTPSFVKAREGETLAGRGARLAGQQRKFVAGEQHLKDLKARPRRLADDPYDYQQYEDHTQAPNYERLTRTERWCCQK